MDTLPKTQEQLKNAKSKPIPVYMRVMKGGFMPADVTAEQQLRDKKFKIGELVKVFVRKIRNPKFNRLSHRIGQLCVSNITEFSNMDAHAVLKRLQLEANVCCDEVAIRPCVSLNILPIEVMRALSPVFEMFGIKLSGDGMMIVRSPRSFSFESMDESEYQDAIKRICRHIAEVYWKNLEPHEIEEMAETMIDE